MNPFTALKNLSPFHFTFFPLSSFLSFFLSSFSFVFFPPPILSTLHFILLCYSPLQLAFLHFLLFIAFTSPPVLHFPNPRLLFLYCEGRKTFFFLLVSQVCQHLHSHCDWLSNVTKCCVWYCALLLLHFVHSPFRATVLCTGVMKLKCNYLYEAVCNTQGPALTRTV